LQVALPNGQRITSIPEQKKKDFATLKKLKYQINQDKNVYILKAARIQPSLPLAH
jgi:hypothetical protein